jgi:hypothetical protein
MLFKFGCILLAETLLESAVTLLEQKDMKS